MARSTKHEWLSIQRIASRRRDPRRQSGLQPFQRRLRIEPLEDRRLLALVTVTTLADTVDFNDGVTSLREAIFATNLVGGADTIDFAPSLTAGGPATLTLTQGELKISDALVINGPGADLLTIDASGNDPTPDSTLNDDDFSNDFDGSRVFNIDDGNFTADKSVSIFGLTLTGGDVYGSGGAIYSRAENLTITGSTISGNSATFGGGILTTSSDLTVTDSTISGNSAVNGGGINSSGDYISLTVTNSTVSDNVARGDEGGISSSGYFNNVSVTGSTISGNTALGSGAGISVRGYHSALTVSDSTISGNSAGGTSGGGIFSGGEVTVANSTISGNSVSRYGGGISGDNITVTDSTISDNSAIDVQFSRGGGIWGINVTVTDSTITGNATGGSGGGIGGDYVTVSGSTVSGNSAGGFSYYNGGGGVFGHVTLTVTGSTISGNSAANGGGLESRYGALTVTDSKISGNSAGENGGGIKGRYVSVTSSTISGNSALGRGGGIDSVVGSLTVTASTISDNSAGTNGGGIHSFDNLTVIGSTISDNSAGTSGGGIESRYGGLTLIDTTISGNSADDDGGGIFSRYGNVTMTGSTISGNSAGGSGGGLYSRLGGVTMIDSTLSGNSAVGNGGGLYIFDAASAIRHSTVTGNSAGNLGGGAFIAGGTLALDHTILAANTATLGPDLTGVIGTTLDVRFSLIGDNAHSGLAATPTGTPDANGNLIGPVVAGEPLTVYVEMAAMGDFEAGPGGDSFLFEYSIDGGAFQPLLTSSVDEAASQTYYMDSGTEVVRDDPLVVNGVVLNRYFQTLSAEIPGSSGQIRVRFTATNDGPNEAFAWRNLYISGQSSGSFVGAAVQFDASSDVFAAYAADPDYAIAGDMFGIRSRLNQGIPSLPFDVVDDSISIFPNDTQGIISEFDGGRFFGVVDTVNGVGSNTNTAIWTFNNIMVPFHPLLGPLADNGGPTMTHALLAGSPAIDAGDPAAVAGVNGVPQFDQRGNPFARIVGAAIDVGALELPPLPPDLLGDYNCSGTVDTADYTMWRNTLHANVAPYSGADGNGNGVVDQADYGVWKAHFGHTLPAPAAASVVAFAEQPPALPGVGTAEMLALAGAQSNPPVEPGAVLPGDNAAAPPPADTVFTLLGQRTPARSTAAVVRTALRNAAVDAAVSDALLLVRQRHVAPTSADDSARPVDLPWHDADAQRERTRGLEDKWRRAVPGSIDLAQIMV